MSEIELLTYKKNETKNGNLVSKPAKNNLSKSANSPFDRNMFLQRTIGNQAVQRLLRSGVLQAKLKINTPGDRYEQEADRVAEQVIASKPPQVPHQGKSQVQRKSISDAPAAPVADNFVQNLGSGQPLDTATREYFEPRFGHDFSDVRVHMDARAAESARAVNARAYTVGRDVVFGTGEYGAGNGHLLMAHELAHVVQQARGSEFIQCKEKESSKVEQYMAAAREAVKYTQEKLPLGMGNPWNKWLDSRNLKRFKSGRQMYGFDREGNENKDLGIIGAVGAAFIPELILTAKRMAELPGDNLLTDQIEEARESGDLQKVKQLQIKVIERTARLGEELGFGNCSEHASISYLYLCNRGTPRPIEMLFTSDHAFVAIGRLATNSSNPKDWNPDTVICDAYYDEVYSLKDGILHERQAGVEKTQGRLED